MKRFRIKTNFKNRIILIILFVLIFDMLIFNIFSKDLSNNVLYLAHIKVEELIKHYMNDTIKKYLNIDTNDYIKLNLVNNNIISVDIDNKNSNLLLKYIINDLESNIEQHIKDSNNYYKLELIEGSNSIIIYIPVGVAFNNSLLDGLGPRLPIKISFLENIDAFVDVEVENYGINNSLVKLYINISVKVIIEMPVDKEVTNINYKYLLASKLINGKVPSIYGSNLGDNSSIVNSGVN